MRRTCREVVVQPAVSRENSADGAEVAVRGPLVVRHVIGLECHDTGQLVGRSPYLQPVHLDGPDHLVGQIVPVKIVTGHKGSLTGELVTAMEPA